MRLWGHPVHPVLVHFPLACWTLAIPLDLLDRVVPTAFARTGAGALIATGCVLALPAMIAGVIDFARMDEDQAALRIAYRHLGFTSTAWVLYASALLIQWTGKGWRFRPSTADLILLMLGAGALAIGAWHGGQLVYHHRVGVAGVDRNHPCEPD